MSRPTKDSAGEPCGFTLTFHDVTHEREVSRMKSDFVSFVTHQLRTPLAGIRWMLELAAQEPGIPAEAASYVQDAREAAQRLIQLVNDLLDVSRLEQGKLTVTAQPVDLRRAHPGGARGDRRRSSGRRATGYRWPETRTAPRGDGRPPARCARWS